jgi:hypothetical protein
MTTALNTSRARALPSTAHIAISAGGEVATGSRRGCDGDQEAIRYFARHGGNIRDGYKIARRYAR